MLTQHTAASQCSPFPHGFDFQKTRGYWGASSRPNTYLWKLHFGGSFPALALVALFLGCT